MQLPVETRIGLAADLAAIARIEERSFDNPGERFGERRISYLLHSPRVVVRVAEIDGKVVGWICGFAVPRSSMPWGRVYALAVDPSARGRKIGARLLQEIIEILRRQGAGRIFLEVRADNHPAMRLYEKFGFVLYRQLANYYGHGHPALRMTLNAADAKEH